MEFSGHWIGWIRQSSDTQHSIQAQVDAFKLFCERHHIEDYTILSFVGSAMDNEADGFFERMRSSGITAYDDYKALLNQGRVDGVWAVDPTRYGRAKWLYNYMVQYAVDHGADIYADGIGIINESNFDAMVAITSIGSQADVKRLHGERAYHTYIQKAKAGIPPRHVNWTHEKIYNGGKVVGMRIKDDSRRLMIRMAHDLIKGKSYREISDLHLQNRNHNEVSRIFYAATTHGNISIGYNHYKRIGMWMVERGHVIPDGMMCFYNVIEPLFEPTLHEKVKQELRIRTKSNSRVSGFTMRNPFTGLVVCDKCGFTMQYDGKEKAGVTYPYLRCGGRCKTNRQLTRLDWLQDWFNERLYYAIEHGIVMVTDTRQDDTTAWESEHADVTQAIARINGILSQLILDKAGAGDELRDLYSQQILKAQSQKEALERDLMRLEQYKPLDPRIQIQAMDELADLTIEGLWQLPTAEINRYLTRLMGDARIAVFGNDYEIISG